MNMSSITEDIKARRNAGSEQALMMLDMVPLSDTDTKYSLLSSAALYLNDRAVAEKWISLLSEETDTALQADMLQRLAAGGLQAIPDKGRFIALLMDILQQNESRDIVLPLLGRFALHDAGARRKLMDFYKSQENADVSRLILSWLLIPVAISEEDIEFYREILNKTDTEDKLVLVNRLLLHDQLDRQQLEELLQPTTPAVIREMVLRYCVDRSIVPEKTLRNIILGDNNPLLRKWSIQLLAIHGISDTAITDAILHALREDPDPAVRQAAMNVFAYSIALTPDNISFLCNCLQTEKNITVAQQLLYLLAPYTEKNSALSDALWNLLELDLQTDIAAGIYDILGRQVAVNTMMFERFMAAYEKEQHDVCKTVILKAITTVMNVGDELNSLYLRALDAPAPAIREWALRGILLIPGTRENTDVIAAAAPALLRSDLADQLRLQLARKLSFIPKLPDAAIQVFSRLADHENNQEIRSICNKVQEKSIAQDGGTRINWEQWLHKADVTHDFSGVFPHIWWFYNDNPPMANSILYAGLNPAASGSLYQAGVSDLEILNFLAAYSGIDDTLSRYALNQLLHTDLGNESKFKWYLLALKSNPSCEELKEGLWLLLEKRGQYINMIQLDELLRLVWKNELDAQFSRRMLRQTTPAGILPYLRYISVNAAAEQVPELLAATAKLPGILQDRDCKEQFITACRNSGQDAEALQRNAAAAPGFADDGPGFAD
ncbi:HEAT repeat domain-containing protein [Chitinophaga sp. 212800010-3]|uniref:HEAT repeat domain-containing protein n=1 Tax=unclassified Chitinophaga TaxID=2619133 RepID=UPI002DEF4602|nr:HEAT repeat domain-containing protein [Chitinophaga sp. 212800010-3]